MLLDGFLALTRVPTGIFAQAFLFALWHFEGFPGGLLGVGMVFFWSVVLGYLRHRSGGMLAPLVAHVCADATIATILLHAVVLAERA